MPLSDSLLGTSPVRRAAYAVGLIALFGLVFGFTWSQAIVVTAVVLVVSPPNSRVRCPGWTNAISDSRSASLP
jgi:hypothetical protein